FSSGQAKRREKIDGHSCVKNSFCWRQIKPLGISPCLDRDNFHPLRGLLGILSRRKHVGKVTDLAQAEIFGALSVAILRDHNSHNSRYGQNGLNFNDVIMSERLPWLFSHVVIGLERLNRVKAYIYAWQCSEQIALPYWQRLFGEIIDHKSPLMRV